LFSRIEELLSLVADDPILAQGLRRERDRLRNHIAHRCDVLGLGPLPTYPPTAWLCRRQRPRAGCRQPRPSLPRLLRRSQALRAACYQALDAGLIASRRFDALMLLGRRAAQCPRSTQPTPSPSPSESLSLGSAAGGIGGLDSGRPGGDTL